MITLCLCDLIHTLFANCIISKELHSQAAYIFCTEYWELRKSSIQPLIIVCTIKKLKRSAEKEISGAFKQEKLI